MNKLKIPPKVLGQKLLKALVIIGTGENWH